MSCLESDEVKTCEKNNDNFIKNEKITLSFDLNGESFQPFQEFKNLTKDYDSLLLPGRETLIETLFNEESIGERKTVEYKKQDASFHNSVESAMHSNHFGNTFEAESYVSKFANSINYNEEGSELNLEFDPNLPVSFKIDSKLDNSFIYKKSKNANNTLDVKQIKIDRGFHKRVKLNSPDCYKCKKIHIVPNANDNLKKSDGSPESDSNYVSQTRKVIRIKRSCNMSIGLINSKSEDSDIKEKESISRNIFHSNEKNVNKCDDFGTMPKKRMKISFDKNPIDTSKTLVFTTSDIGGKMKKEIDSIREKVITSTSKKLNKIQTTLKKISSGIKEPFTRVEVKPQLKSTYSVDIDNMLLKYFEKTFSFETYNENGLNFDYIELFSKLDAVKLYTYLEEQIEYFPQHLQKVHIFGKWHRIPRKQVAYGDAGLTYTFSGITLPAKPWTPLLSAIRDLVCHVTGANFNFVLLNRYKDGNDRIGEHQDDESDLDLRAPIASLSFGAQRDFVFRHKDAKFHGADIEPVTILLKAGSLLVMKHPTNEIWYHSLPPRKHVIIPRINLTFRVMRTGSSTSI